MAMDEGAKRLRAKLIWCAVSMVLSGAAGGGAALLIGVPDAFYLGFFTGFVLAGLISLFVLAVHFSPPSK
jgi:hypothetical protein